MNSLFGYYSWTPFWLIFVVANTPRTTYRRRSETSPPSPALSTTTRHPHRCSLQSTARTSSRNWEESMWPLRTPILHPDFLRSKWDKAAGPKEPTKNPKNRRLHLLLQKKPIQRACASSRTFIQDFVFHATIIHKKTFSERTKKNKNPTFVVAFTFSYCIYLYKVAFTFSFNVLHFFHNIPNILK